MANSSHQLIETIKLITGLSLRLCVFAGIWLVFSCSSKPTDLRSLAPADSLIYLETNDLGAALQPIVDSKAFNEAAKAQPDLSAIRGVQLAIAVTGFETSEERVSEENSVLNFKPHFAAIVDTHTWEWQTKSFAENQLGEFINKVYGGAVQLETTPKNGGTNYVWTAENGRKAYAFATGSLIFFGNDESSIDKIQAVRRGEADPISKPGKLPNASDNLAVGYVSTDGIAQIANIIGIQKAKESGEETEVQSAVASILPQLLRNSITEIAWTSTKTELGIEDKYLIRTNPEISEVFSETFIPDGEAKPIQYSRLSELPSITRYNLKDPQVAWRSVLLSTQKQVDLFSGKIINEIAGSLFEPYGIRDPEAFLSAVDGNILTAKADEEGENRFVVATFREFAKVKRSIADVKPGGHTEEGVVFWKTKDGEIEAVIESDNIIIGSPKGVGSAFSGGRFPVTQPEKNELDRLQQSSAPITTVGRDDESARIVADVLSQKKYDDLKVKTIYFTETRFTKNGIERKTLSDFGLIGEIITRLAPEE